MLYEYDSYGPINGSQAYYLLPGRDKKLAFVCISITLLSTLFCSTVSPHSLRFSQWKKQYIHILSSASSSMLCKASTQGSIMLHPPQKYTTAHPWVYRMAHSYWEISLHFNFFPALLRYYWYITHVNFRCATHIHCEVITT